MVNPHIFREYDIRGVIGVDLTPDAVTLLGRGIGSFFRRSEVRKISVGRDGRLSSPDVSAALTEGLNAAGVDVVDLGLVPTPLSYYSTHRLNVDGSVMVTGSHNPPDYNGFKISMRTSAIYGDQIQEIKSIIEKRDFVNGTGSVEEYDLKPAYIEDLADNLHVSRTVKVAVDAGNGVGGITAAPLLKRLGCDLTMLFGEVDGKFPNHHPDPTVESNLTALKETVVSGGFELGVAYDGDGDRIGVIDENGKVLWGDQILAVLARDVLAEEPGATVIGEVKCSQALFEDIADHGGKPLMWKVGHSLIKSKMYETGAQLAGEMSGHIFFRHRYYGFDDAVYVTGRLLEIVAKSDRPVSELLTHWPKLINTPEIRLECPDKIKFSVVEHVRDSFRHKYDVVDVDGMRVIMPGGWGLLRASNTQPVAVLRFEAESAKRLEEIKAEVESVFYEWRDKLSDNG